MSSITKSLIGRQDLKWWDGSDTKTFPRKTSTGGTVDMFSVGDEVNVQSLYCPTVADMTGAAISLAITKVAGNDCVLILSPGEWAISNDLTIPANIIIHLAFGAYFSIATGKVLTFINPPDAGPFQIFTGLGTATVTGYPQDRAWWGETQRNDFQNVTLDYGLISIRDFNETVIHQFSLDLLAQTSDTLGFF
jgi:hypothetical protein